MAHDTMNHQLNVCGLAFDNCTQVMLSFSVNRKIIAYYVPAVVYYRVICRVSLQGTGWIRRVVKYLAGILRRTLSWFMERWCRRKNLD